MPALVAGCHAEARSDRAGLALSRRYLDSWPQADPAVWQQLSVDAEAAYAADEGADPPKPTPIMKP